MRRFRIVLSSVAGAVALAALFALPAAAGALPNHNDTLIPA